MTVSTSTIERKILRPADVMEMYGISRSTLNKWIQQKKIAEPNRMSKRFLWWRPEDIDTGIQP